MDNNAQYMDLFVDESREHISSLNDRLLELEQSPTDLDIVNVIFRSAHTLKGMAGTMGFQNMMHLTHQMENGLDDIRNHKREITPSIIDVLLNCVDQLERQLDQITSKGTDDGIDTSATLAKLAEAFGQQNPGGQESKTEPEAGANVPTLTLDPDTLSHVESQGKRAYCVRVTLEPSCSMKGVRAFMVMDAIGHVGDVLVSEPDAQQLEEGAFADSFDLILVTDASKDDVVSTISSVSEVLNVVAWELKSVPPTVDTPKSTSTPSTESPNVSKERTAVAPSKKTASKSIRVDLERLDSLMNLFSEFVIDKTRLEMITNQNKGVHGLSETVQHLSRVGADLQDIVMKIRMVPVESVFNRFPRMVRDLAKNLGKQVTLEIYGAETELDRTLIDEIGDPLVHLLRNSLDHGLETPEERNQSGKDSTGTVKLSAYQAGNHVFIEIGDDGHGINRDKVLKKAIERGLVDASRSATLTDQQVFDFLFQSGFSTADTISDLSGRGVGLDVVKSTIVSLGGDVSVDSTPGQGTTFTIQLPLTLSILQAMLVRLEDEIYAVPLNAIVQMDAVKRADVHSVHGNEMMHFQDRVIPIVYLRERFLLPSDHTTDLSVVILGKGDRRVGLAVDEFIGQQEVVLKSFGNYFRTSLPGISGGTILGDGDVALIVDPTAFIQ